MEYISIVAASYGLEETLERPLDEPAEQGNDHEVSGCALVRVAMTSGQCEARYLQLLPGLVGDTQMLLHVSGIRLHAPSLAP